MGVTHLLTPHQMPTEMLVCSTTANLAPTHGKLRYDKKESRHSNRIIIIYRTYKTFMCQFMLTQIEAYESTSNSQGWFFWTAKTENHVAPEWDYLFLLKQGIAPNNLCKVNKTMCPHKS